MQFIKNNTTVKLIAGRVVQLYCFSQRSPTLNDESYFWWHFVLDSVLYTWYIFCNAYAVIFDNSFQIFDE